jgi:hypothetical protein
MVRAPHSDLLWINISQNSSIPQNQIKETFIQQFNRLIESDLDI